MLLSKEPILSPTQVSIAVINGYVAVVFLMLLILTKEKMRGKVLFDFSPQAVNQIALRAGQIVDITSYGGAGGWSSAVEIGTGVVYLNLALYVIFYADIFTFFIDKEKLDIFLVIMLKL